MGSCGRGADARSWRLAPSRERLFGLVLVDHPAYRHRGLSLDVVVHLHLTDDQAWRVEIPALPELTEVFGVGAVGGVAATEARGGLACGHYTLSDLGFRAAEAEARGIILLPEFDVPGHTNAALVAMPGLNPDGVVPAVHEGGEVGFSTIHIGAPDTERFLDEVIAALAPYAPIGVHIGGDECFATSREEYEALVGAIVAKVHDAGRRVIAWQEAAGQLREGDMVQMWDPRLSSAAVAEATRRGVKVLVSAANRVYLDMKQVEGQELGLDWMGIVPLRTALEWEPAEVVEGVVPGAIEGVEACLWTETVFTAADLGTMVLPRLTAVAEVAWAGSGVGQWESFRCRVAAFARLWRARGWAFFPDAGVTWP